RVLRCRVAEPGSWLPGVCAVARRTVSAQLAAVFISMATLALGQQSQVSVIQILQQNPGARTGGNVRGFVAIVTAGCRMAAGQRKTCLAMVDRFPVWLPANQREIGAVVFGVTNGAIFAGRIRGHPRRMHTVPLCDALPDLRVAI